MRDWGPLDFIAYGALGATAIFLAINSGIALPAIRKKVPSELKGPGWGFLPIICFVIATVAFVARLFTAPVVQPQIAQPTSQAAPTTDSDSIRRLSYQLSQEIDDFYDSYNSRRRSIQSETVSETKAADTEALEKEISNEFKEKFKFRYLSLVEGMNKLGINTYNPLNFDNAIIGPGEILGSASWLNTHARVLK
jgi:hypothetical protein